MRKKRHSRREFIRGIAGISAGALMTGCSLMTTTRPPRKRPNIILFLSDDHSIVDAGCYGNSVVQTPNIDRLAGEGMRFDNVFSASPTCAPSRSSLYTGLFPHRHGAHPNHGKAREGVKSLPHYMRSLGYRTILVGKAHIPLDERFPFERFATGSKEKYVVVEEGNKLDELFSTLPGSQPFCLVLATNDPHVPWRVKTSYDPNDIELPPYLLDTEATRRALARYYADVTAMDKELGLTLDLVAKHGLEENTLVIYTSDQGAQTSHAKWNLYDAGIKVPFIARWPGRIKPGTTTEAMISFVDLVPTFIETGGGDPGGVVARCGGDRLDGRSFLPVLTGEQHEFRDLIHATHTRDGTMNVYPMRCVRTDTHKYIRNFAHEWPFSTHLTVYHAEWRSWARKAEGDPIAAERVKLTEYRPPEELYDLRADPHELNNLAGESASGPLLLSFRKQLDSWMKEQGDPGNDIPRRQFEQGVKARAKIAEKIKKKIQRWKIKNIEKS
ncbi:sulfatase [Candidatus Hydrogenedentota bacterium]